MRSSQQEIIINHAAKDLFKIVLDIEKYPEFIPWCYSIDIKSKSKNEILADMIVNYNFFPRQIFSSHVLFNKKQLFINTNYVDGPLKDLRTKWFFKILEPKKTKILFSIKYKFKKILHQEISELFLGLIENKMIDSFKKRADEILD